jgi:hypothetical protein
VGDSTILIDVQALILGSLLGLFTLFLLQSHCDSVSQCPRIKKHWELE